MILNKSPKIEFLNMDNMEFMKGIPDKFYELAIIDPEYGIGEDGLKNHSRGKLAKSKEYTPKSWDSKPSDKIYFNELFRVSKNQIIFGANHFIENIPFKNSSCWIVWDKQNGGTDFADCELAYTSFKTAVRKIELRWHGMIQHDMKNKEHRIHPTQKPVALYKWLLTNYAKQGDNILDTHGGSFSSAIACYELGFDFTGIELDKEYFDNAVNRFNTHKSQLKLF